MEFDIENEIFSTKLNDDYKEYYEMTTSIILGEYDSTENDDSLFIVFFF